MSKKTVACLAIHENKILTYLAILQNKILTCLVILQNKISRGILQSTYIAISIHALQNKISRGTLQCIHTLKNKIVTSIHTLKKLN
jgi:hypothetical protein